MDTTKEEKIASSLKQTYQLVIHQEIANIRICYAQFLSGLTVTIQLRLTKLPEERTEFQNFLIALFVPSAATGISGL